MTQQTTSVLGTALAPTLNRPLSGEPLLEEVLADPLVHLLMARDGVSGASLRAAIAAARHRLAGGDEAQRSSRAA